MKKYKSLLMTFLLIINLLFILFFFIGCDYFKLMSREDWEKNNGVENNLFLYVLLANKTIDIYKINYDEDKVNKKSNTNITVGGVNNPCDIITDINNDYLYTSGGVGGAGTIKNLGVFKINNSGELNELLDKSINCKTDNPEYFISGKIKNFLYTFNSSYKLTCHKFNSNNGILEEISGSPFGTGCFGSSDKFIVDKNENYLYFAALAYAPYNTGILIYKIGENGLLSFINQITVPAGIGSITIHPSGNFLYAGESIPTANLNTLHIYSINKETGYLSHISGSPYVLFPSLGAISRNAVTIACHPNGKFLYIGSTQPNQRVFIYKIDEFTGQLTEYYYKDISGYSPSTIKIDDSGKFLFIAQKGSSNPIHIYKIDNGDLNEINSSPISGFSSIISDIEVVFKKSN